MTSWMILKDATHWLASRVTFATNNCNIKLIWLTCQPWSRQPGSPRSLRRRRQHPLHCWPAGTWCWRTPPPAPHTACRGRKQQPNIFKCVGILFDAFLYIYHSHLPLNWEILKVFSEPFSSPLISSTGAEPRDEIVIRNISEKITIVDSFSILFEELFFKKE